MNIVVTVGVIMTIAFLAVQGCSGETRSTAKEFGNDLKRDVNAAAQDIDRKVEDATD
jgi:hypothetical protein